MKMIEKKKMKKRKNGATLNISIAGTKRKMQEHTLFVGVVTRIGISNA